MITKTREIYKALQVKETTKQEGIGKLNILIFWCLFLADHLPVNLHSLISAVHNFLNMYFPFLQQQSDKVSLSVPSSDLGATVGSSFKVTSDNGPQDGT